MKWEEDGCVDCGLPCLGSACPLRHETHYGCDICHQECSKDDLHDVEGVEVCGECLIPYLQKKGVIGGSTDDNEFHIVDGVKVNDDNLISYLEETGKIGKAVENDESPY